MRTIRPSLLTGLLVTALVTGSGLAQIIPTAVNNQNRTGDLPFSTSVGTDIEHVDIGSGDLVVRIPIVSVKGRGSNYNYALQYHGHFWLADTEYSDSTGYYQDWETENYYGLLGTVGSSLGWADNTSGITRATVKFPCGINNETYETSYILTDPSGVKHPLATQFTNGGVCRANDKGPDLTGQGISSNASLTSVQLADGSNATYADNSITTIGSWTDANGNINGNGTGTLDTLGRTLVTQQNGTNSLTYQVRDSNGVLQSYTVNLTTVNLNTNFDVTTVFGRITEYNGSWNVVSSIVLPNGQSYQFQYENGTYGALTQITLPTGSTINYTWATFSDDVRTYRYVASRTVHVAGNNYTWNFSRTGSDNNITATVTDPLQNQTVYGVDFGVVNSAQFYHGSPTGNPIRKHVIDYVWDQDPWYNPSQRGPENEAQQVGTRPIRITTTLDNGQVSKKEFDYETFTYTFHVTLGDGCNGCGGQPPPQTFTTSRGNVTEIREFDYGAVPSSYGSGTPGALIRRTDKTYLHNSYPAYLTANIVSKVLQETIYDGASNQVAQTQYEYDNLSNPGTNPLLNTQTPGPPAPQHDYTNHSVSFTTRGNATRLSRWRNTDGHLVTSVYQYDDLGNIRQITDPLSHSTTWTYSDSWSGTFCPPPNGYNGQAYPTQMTDALSHRVQVSYFPCTGLTQAQKDENDIQAGRAGTTHLYDLMGRSTQTNQPDGGQTSHSYNDVPPVSVNTTTAITTSLNMTSVAIKDGLGRVTETQLTSDPAGTTYVDTSYDQLGRKATVSNPHRSTSSSTDGTTTYGYDPLNRVTSVLEPDGSQVLTSYTGSCTTVTDEAQKARQSCVDGLGRLSGVWEDPNTLNYETDYAYDPLGNLLSVNQKGGSTNSANWRTRTFNYNSLSQLLSASNPESGAVSYTYDDGGNLHTKTSPQANQPSPSVTTTISYCYDVVNRLTGKAYTQQNCPLTSPAASYFYDQTSYNGLTILNGIGARTGMSDSAGTTAWSYDSMGRVLNEKRTIGSITKGIAYTYNLDGSDATVAYPSGKIITYTPNAAAEMVSAVDSGTGINYVTNAVYAPPGQLSGLTNGASISSALTYNSRLQPLQLYFTTGTISATTLTQLQQTACPTATAAIMSRSYNFGAGANDNGDVLSIANCRDNDRRQNFTYDHLNRITQAYTTGSNWGETFTIDAWANLTNRAQVSGKTYYEPLNAPANVNNQLTGFGYDAAGNMTSNGSTTYTYDSENRIASTAGWTYTYDGDGDRVKKANGSTGTLYWTGASGGALAETNLSGNPVEEYIFFDGQRVARRDGSGSTVHYYFADHLKSVSVVTSNVGAIQQESDYYPYGGEMVISGSDSNHHKFTGKERDSESGLDYFVRRHHASSLGRFMTPDPIHIMKQKFTDPQQWNMYSYVRNNPLRFVDPTGMYLAGCGSGVKNCDKQIQNLDKSLQNALKSKDPNIVKAAQAYGKLGDPNGVNVSLVKVVDPDHPNVTGKTTDLGKSGGYTVDPATGKVQQATQVDIRAGMGGSQLEETAVHEGVHVEDRANFVNSITTPTTFDRSLNITGRQSERNAYGVENEWRDLHGMPVLDINNILAHPPYSDNPNIDKPLFPNVPGPE